ncbi:unnamed protein product [Medioppia subpectinata]|uniref:Uncharacterized protein n=1 Tax=Medioppia subpectinata TaxID=1979941 RepID=A0A7R9Q382_9ACAR|nr:unnamed protein product [Medioppia subpectinata]CAG2111143.1 unnamed protein product [Medioppia subpectinata]
MNAIEGSLTPKSLYELPEQFTQELVRILTLMPKWIEQSMKTLSTQIMAKKLESCKIVVSQPENVTLMCREIKCVETQEIWSQMVTLLSDSVLSETIRKSFSDLIHGIAQDISFEYITDWVNSIVDRYVVNLSETIRKSFSDLIHGIAQDISFEYITDWVNSIVDRYVVNGKYACLTSRASQLVFALGTYLSEEYTLLTVCRSIRHESQSVRRLTIMKQPLNNSQQNNCFNNNHINNNATSQAISSVPDSVVDNNCPQQTYNDVNQWMALQCYQWDQYSDDYSQNYSSPTTYSWTDSQYVECLNDQFMANTNPTITSNGNVYTCLS